MNLSSIVPNRDRSRSVGTGPGSSFTALVATTYLAELARLYDVAHPHAKLLSSIVCLSCVSSVRRRGTAAFPSAHLTAYHALPAASALPGKTLPMWSATSSVPPSSTTIYLSQVRSRLEKPSSTKQWTQSVWRLSNSFSHPTTFSSPQGTPELLASTLRLIYDSVVEKGEIRVPLPDEDVQALPESRSYQRTTSLGYLVHALGSLDLSPRDIMVYAGPLPWRSIKWITFQCPEPTCPYVTMIRNRTRILDDTADHVQQGEQLKLFEP